MLAGCSGPEGDDRREATPIQLGVALETYHYDVTALEEWEDAVGARADILQTFVSWEYDGEPGLNRFPADRAARISEGDRTVEVTWVPSNPDGGVDQPDFSLDSIAGGEHDDYVRSFAQDVEDSGLAIRLRLGHEMNGAWQSFSEQNSGNEAGDFARAWRHVHDVFTDVGATDVQWVWSPNVEHDGDTALEGLYPGDAFVDVVGIDGYSYSTSGCPDPEELFGSTAASVREITGRPLWLAEVGVGVDCPGRDQWITELFSWAHEAGVAGVTWWERGGNGTDYALLDDRSSLSAYREAVAAR